MDLEQLSNQLARIIEARGFADPKPYLKASQQILVDHPMVNGFVLPPGTVIEGDLVLDGDLWYGRRFGTIAALGDLDIKGRIINDDSDGGPFLIVAGNLSAAQSIAGGSSVLVLGSLRCSGVVFCDYNHGRLAVAGDLDAPALIINDATVEIAGRWPADVVSGEIGNLRDRLVAEVFADADDPEDEWPDGSLIRERLGAGLPVLRPLSPANQPTGT